MEEPHSLHANFVTGPGSQLCCLQLPLPQGLPFLPFPVCQVPESTLQPRSRPALGPPKEVKQGQDWSLSSP